jgi:alpha-L-fucosidase
MELIELFNPVNFDPDVWAKLIKASGAKFAGPVAWHGSPYMHWDSEFSDTNSVAMNPHIDIVGELEKAYRKAGLKFMMSYHYGIGMNDKWIHFAKEGVDKFSPDLFWVDAGFGGTKGGHHRKVLDNSKYIGEKELSHGALAERYQLEFISYYYNHAVAQNKEVAFIYKSHDIPPGVAIRDLENGLLNQIAYDTWMTDMDMSVPPDWETHGWFYRDGVPLRTGNDIIDILVDVVSKNGILLLNVPPMADGTFSEETETYLLEVGEWLKVNGEAIYGASPWFIFGEGPSKAPAGNYSMHHNNHFAQVKFGAEDIRYTVNGPYLYATCLGWPGESLTIRSLNSAYRVGEGSIRSVTLLGYEEELSWTHHPGGLTIDLPEEVPGNFAYVFKIERL